MFDPLEPVYIQFGGTNSALGVEKGHKEVVPAIYLLYIDNKEFKTLVTNSILNIIEIALLFTGVGAVVSGTLKGARLVWALADVVISTASLFIRAFEDKIYDMRGGPQFLKYWNIAQMMIGLYGIGRVIKSAPQTISDLSKSWKNIKDIPTNQSKLNEIDGKELNDFEKSIDEFDEALKAVDKTELENLDETADPRKNTTFDDKKSSLDEVNGAGGVLVTINGRQFIKRTFGTNSAEVFIDANSTYVYYYINNDFNMPYAQFHLEGRVFTPGIEVPSSLRNQGIGKSTFNDAFERLGGSSKIDRIKSDWAGKSSVSDNFDSFKKALLENKTAKEAAFETATGKWAKELGFIDVILDPSDVQGIKDGIKYTIEPIFIK